MFLVSKNIIDNLFISELLSTTCPAHPQIDQDILPETWAEDAVQFCQDSSWFSAFFTQKLEKISQTSN